MNKKQFKILIFLISFIFPMLASANESVQIDSLTTECENIAHYFEFEADAEDLKVRLKLIMQPCLLVLLQ